MYRSSATLEDVYRLALPAQTQLLVGAGALNRTVSWACSLRPSAPAFPKLDGDELALVDMDDLRQLDVNMRLDRVVRGLQSARISAIAVLGNIDDQAVSAARAERIPLFQLPSSLPLVQVERAVIRLIVDRAGYIAQRSAELQRELNQAALDGGGFPTIAQYIQQFVQQPMILLREDSSRAAHAGLAHLSEAQRNRLFEMLPNVTTLRSWAASQSHTDSHQRLGQPMDALPIALTLGSSIGATPSRDDYTEVVVAPVYASDAVQGYALLLRPQHAAGQAVTAVEEIGINQGAAAAALEWTKQNAVGVAEERMRAAFVDELLAAEIADEQAWIQRGASLGYDLTHPHVAWIVQATNVADWPHPLHALVEEYGVNAPISRRDEGMLLFWPIDNPKSGRELKVVANTFVARILATSPNAEVVVGIGRPGVGPAQWPQSQQQARESWRLGREWKAAPVTYFGDLGLYQLLSGLGGNAEAARFFRRTLGKLITHDENHNAELVETLEAFFAANTNVSQTATRLHVHRNTLTYRLDRISEITRLDLNDPDARFSLQLALKLRPVLKATL